MAGCSAVEATALPYVDTDLDQPGVRDAVRVPGGLQAGCRRGLTGGLAR